MEILSRKLKNINNLSIGTHSKDGSVLAGTRWCCRDPLQCPCSKSQISLWISLSEQCRQCPVWWRNWRRSRPSTFWSAYQLLGNWPRSFCPPGSHSWRWSQAQLFSLWYPCPSTSRKLSLGWNGCLASVRGKSSVQKTLCLRTQTLAAYRILW